MLTPDRTTPPAQYLAEVYLRCYAKRCGVPIHLSCGGSLGREGTQTGVSDEMITTAAVELVPATSTHEQLIRYARHFIMST